MTAALARLREPIAEKAVTGQSKYGQAAFGAQFAQVSIDPNTMHIQVEWLVGAFARGRIINPLTVQSQLLGGMVWGLGQALLEETVTDPRTGRWVNGNLGEAIVPTHADVAGFEVIMLEQDDTRTHPLGVKGLAEIGNAGTATIANAIFHATRQRLTSLPMRLDHLLGGDSSTRLPP